MHYKKMQNQISGGGVENAEPENQDRKTENQGNCENHSYVCSAVAICVSVNQTYACDINVW